MKKLSATSDHTLRQHISCMNESPSRRGKKLTEHHRNSRLNFRAPVSHATSLFNLTSNDLNTSSNNTTISQMIAERCSKKDQQMLQRDQVKRSDLSKQILQLTSGSRWPTSREYEVAGSKSPSGNDCEDYVMLSPIKEVTLRDNASPMKTRAYNARGFDYSKQLIKSSQYQRPSPEGQDYNYQNYYDIFHELNKRKTQLEKKSISKLGARSKSAEFICNPKDSHYTDKNLYSTNVAPLSSAVLNQAANCRSRSRTRNISRKYSMNNGPNNTIMRSKSSATMSHNVTPSSENYVFLDRLQPKADSSQQSWSSSRRPVSCYDYIQAESPPRRMSSNTNSLSDIRQSSQSGDFYHLNLYVSNKISESTSTRLQPNFQSACNNHAPISEPQVYYSLDV